MISITVYGVRKIGGDPAEIYGKRGALATHPDLLFGNKGAARKSIARYIKPVYGHPVFANTTKDNWELVEMRIDTTLVGVVS